MKLIIKNAITFLNEKTNWKSIFLRYDTKKYTVAAGVMSFKEIPSVSFFNNKLFWYWRESDRLYIRVLWFIIQVVHSSNNLY